MKIIRKSLDNFTLFRYFEYYGFNFFNKLNKYKTCSFDCEEDGVVKIKYASIKYVGPWGNLYLESEGNKFELNWFECWDYVL